MVELFANRGDPDQTPRSEASDLGLHCLLVTRLGVPSLQWVNVELMGMCGIVITSPSKRELDTLLFVGL